MQGTARYWKTIAAGGVLAVGALIFARPVLIVGAMGLWMWTLIAQIRFAACIREFCEKARITHEIEDGAVAARTTCHARLGIEAVIPPSCRVRLQGSPPVSAIDQGSHNSDRIITLDGVPTDRNENEVTESSVDSTTQISPTQSVETKYEMRLPAAGETSLGDVGITIFDKWGPFTQSFSRTGTGRQSTQVYPYGPEAVHIGTGGEPVGRGYGEHDAQRGGGGIDPLELREYVPGDAVSDIDWNATARLAEAYVREYEAATTRQVLLIVDNRPEMSLGTTGRTRRDHIRSVGHAIIRTADTLSDPLGWVAVSDDGLETFVDPQSTPRQYQRARQFLDRQQESEQYRIGMDEIRNQVDVTDREITPTPAPTLLKQSSGRQDGNPQSLTDRQQMARTLAAEESQFANRVQPFFAEQTGYMQAIGADPLFHSTKIATTRTPGTVWSIILTSDDKRQEVLETVRMAQRDDGHVLVFLTPAALFSGDESIDDTYARYRSFEEFRQRLSRYDRVQAFEVAPQDRLLDVLNRRRVGESDDRREVASVQ